jgi:hypothetical protein
MDARPAEETMAEPRASSGPGPGVWVGALLAVVVVGLVVFFLLQR